MERVTISMSDQLAAELAAFVDDYRYANRSEAMRDLARIGLERTRIDDSARGQCVATLSYVYNHEMRELSKRLMETHHAHHDLQIATMHVHLDHDHCLEVVVLRGEASVVKEFSKSVMAERGVKHGQISLVPVTVEADTHRHGGRKRSHAEAHTHTHPAD